MKLVVEGKFEFDLGEEFESDVMPSADEVFMTMAKYGQDTFSYFRIERLELVK